MNNNIDDNYDYDDEDLIPHRHNFSALNSIILQEPTPEEIEAKKKEAEIYKAISKYDILYNGMEKLMYQAALRGENLDDAYNHLKGWASFM